MTAEHNNRSSEKWLERALADAVAERGGVAVKLTSPGLSGLPDRLVLWPGGRAEFVELKSTGRTLRPLQQLVRDTLERMKFRCTVIDNEEKLKQWLHSNRDPTRTW